MKRLIVLLLCLAMILPLAACGTSTDKLRLVRARVDDENVAALVCETGKVLKLLDTKDAVVTRDRKTVVWISTDGTLNCAPYNADKTDLSKAEELAKKAEALLAVSDKGVCFYNEDRDLFRVLFADKKVVKVSKEASGVTCTANSDLFYAVDGDVFFMAHDSEESQRISSYEGDVRFWTPSEVTAELIWADYNGSEYTDTVYYFDGKENVKLCELKNYGYGSNVLVNASPSGDYVAVYSYTDSILMLKAPGGDFVKVDLRSEVETGVFTKDGALGETDSSNLDGVYVAASQDDYKTVYWAGFDGDREKIVSKVTEFSVSQGVLYYLNEEKTLYKTNAAGASTIEGERIATEVDAFVVSNGVLYYMKDTEESPDLSLGGTGSLYVLAAGASEPVRIASDVYADYFSGYSSPDTIYCRVWLADDGKTVLYLKNPESHSYTTYGSLFRYTIGAKEPERIMGDVGEYYIYCPKVKPYSDCIIFGKYIDKETSEDNRLYDWYFYDGKEAFCFARKAA